MTRSRDSEPDAIPPGIYERVVDQGIERLLKGLPDLGHNAEILPLDLSESHAILADHLRRIVAKSSKLCRRTIGLIVRLLCITRSLGCSSTIPEMGDCCPNPPGA